MLKLGRINKVKITAVKKDVYEIEEGRHCFIIPKFRLPGPRKAGDEIDGFIYSDRKGSFILTPQKPYALIGEFANMKILDLTRSGAFADWGIETDLFIPINEMEVPVKKDNFYTVFVKMDRNLKQIIGTTKIKEYLSEPDQYIKEQDKVKFFVTSLHKHGYRVIIENKYSGLVFKEDVIGELKPGEKKTGIVKKISEDGRIDISLFRGPAGMQLHAEKVVLELLKKSGGFLPLHDKTLPMVIESKTGMSKKLFKKTIGSLYRMKKIVLKENGIQLKSKK